MSYFYGRQMACPYRLSAAHIMGLTAGVLLGISTGSPHDMRRPELNTWFRVLRTGRAYVVVTTEKPSMWKPCGT